MKKLRWLICMAVLISLQPLTAQEESMALKHTESKSNSVGNAIDGIRTELKANKSGLKKADRAYRDLGFQHSIQQTFQSADFNNMSEEAMVHLANSFRLNSQTEEAEYWYSRFISEESQPKHLLHYAQVLQSNGKCEDAVRWYKRFKEKADRKEWKNRALLQDCEHLKVITVHQDVVITNEKALNSRYLDFSPVYYRDGLIFSTTRGTGSGTELIDAWTNDHFSDLFYAPQSSTQDFSTPSPINGDLNKRYHDGTATFDQSGMVMFFTRSNNNGRSSSKQGLVDLKIYSAVDDNGYWTNVQEMPFNSNEFTSCHPSLSFDGRQLYFASNRPGGFGGMDIYVSEYLGGMWQEPRNLGPTVNSAGNEIFPVITQNDELYFSSNGHHGLGGLDIFKAQKNTLDDEQSWNTRENIGAPFNSPKDDFGFIVHPNGTEGYLTSNRKGGYGKDDIYRWKSSGKPQGDGSIVRTICVVDDHGERVPDAQVEILEKRQAGQQGHDQMMLTLEPVDEKKDKFLLAITGPGKDHEALNRTYRTDENGFFKFRLQPGKAYVFRAQKEGFKLSETYAQFEEIKVQEEYCLPLNKVHCVLLNGTVKNKVSAAVMPGSTVEVLNKCSYETMKAVADEDGRFEMCMDCGCDYRISATKEGFQYDYEFVYANRINCDTARNIYTLLELEQRRTNIVDKRRDPMADSSDPASPVDDNVVPITTYREVVTYVPQTTLEPVTSYIPISSLVNDPNANIEEGQIISLKDIYYDFDKYNIRPDASIDLHHVVDLLKKYPSLEIELGSHTDCRGTHKYNRWLSSKRAKEARAFILSRGIARHRVTARGYGETVLRNECADGVDCSEEKHQQNRRTEVKVTKFNEVGTTIRDQH
ncbi:MAG: OmpA family protein [Bacteroidota bacterium]